MAVFPCDWSAHRYPGPQRSLYVTFASGTLATTTKLRFCERHFREAMDIAGKHFAEVDEESQMSLSCDECNADRSGSLFVKAFDEHAEPRQLVADLCAGCAAKLAAMLKVGNGRALSER